ncbi:17212_t:CDS:2 [Entrophospora sp. SA101]|nr:17212_t:CDS:2 [Entrophospora sp. SA101]
MISKVVSEIDDNKNSYGKENDLEMMDVLKLAIKSNNNPIKLFTELNDQAFGMAAIMGLDPPLFSICHILSPL